MKNTPWSFIRGRIKNGKSPRRTDPSQDQPLLLGCRAGGWLHDKFALHVAVPEAAKLGALKRERAGLNGVEFHPEPAAIHPRGPFRPAANYVENAGLLQVSKSGSSDAV